MNKEEFDMSVSKLENHIMVMLALSRESKEDIDEKQLEENILFNLQHHCSRIQQTIEKSNDTENEQDLKRRLEEIESMINVFKINPQDTIKRCIKKFYESVKENEQANGVSDKQKSNIGILTNLVRYNNEQMKKSTQELISEMKCEKQGDIREIFTQMQDDVER